jgi:hypothetical protein
MSDTTVNNRILLDDYGAFCLDTTEPKNIILVYKEDKVNERIKSLTKKELIYFATRISEVEKTLSTYIKSELISRGLTDIPKAEDTGVHEDILEASKELTEETVSILSDLFSLNQEQLRIYKGIFKMWNIDTCDAITTGIFTPLSKIIMEALQNTQTEEMKSHEELQTNLRELTESIEKMKNDFPSGGYPEYIEFGLKKGHIQMLGDGTQRCTLLAGLSGLGKWKIDFEKETGLNFPNPQPLEKVVVRFDKKKNKYVEYSDNVIKNNL